MNPTYKIVRQYFAQYPVLKSVENYQCLVIFIFLFIFVLCFLGDVCYGQSNFIAFSVRHNKSLIEAFYCFGIQLFRQRLSKKKKSVKASATIPKGNLGNAK